MQCKYENCEEIMEGNNLFCDKHMKDVLYEVFGEPQPEADRPEQIPAVVRSEWPNKLILCESEEHANGTDANLSISPMGETNEYIDLEIEYSDYYNSNHCCLQIDKDMAMNIVNYLRNHYGI